MKFAKILYSDDLRIPKEFVVVDSRGLVVQNPHGLTRIHVNSSRLIWGANRHLICVMICTEFRSFLLSVPGAASLPGPQALPLFLF